MSTMRDRIQCYKCREYDLSYFKRGNGNTTAPTNAEFRRQTDSTTSIMTGTQDNFSRMDTEENSGNGHLNLGMNDPTAFLPFGPKIGGQTSKDNHPTVGQCLTKEQANYIYKKSEAGELINTNTIFQELEYKKQLSRMDDTSG